MKIYLMRHCEAEDGPQLQTDRKLTSVGKAQIPVVAHFLESQTSKIGLVLCSSDLKRGIDTGEGIAEKLGVDVVQSPDVDPPNNEGTVATSDITRVWKTIKREAGKLEADEELLVVSHGPLVNALAAYLIGSDQGDRFHFSHGTVTHWDTAAPDTSTGYPTAAGRGENVIAYLHWMMTPKGMLRAMERDRKAEIEEALRIADAILEEAKQGLKHPRHAKKLDPLKKKARGILKQYWKQQKAALLEEIRPKLKEAKKKNSPFLVGAAALLMSPDEKDGTAWSDGIAAAAKAGAVTVAGDGATSAYKSSFDDILGSINSTTRMRLESALEDGEDAELAISQAFDGFDAGRLDSIVDYEFGQAYNSGQKDGAREEGLDLKYWDPAGECCEEICQANVDDGGIPLDDDFSSGDDVPPGHPNCDCSVTFEREEAAA